MTINEKPICCNATMRRLINSKQLTVRLL